MILFISGVLLVIIFSLGWVYARRINNVSLVDAMWALALPIPVILYLYAHDGWWVRQILLGVMAVMWSFRLGSHLMNRIVSHHPKEDARYAKLRKMWEDKYSDKPQRVQVNFLIIFIINAILVFLLSQPFYAAAQVDGIFKEIEIVGLVVFIIGWIGEMMSDYQLNKFKKLKKSGEITDTVCQLGLWNYSRHPNYFFESVIWVGIYLFCATTLLGITTIYAPIIITFLLIKVTGIPSLEKSMLQSKGEAYQRYQDSTSAFVPWFKKSKQS